jgi:hypothetical protein
MRLGEGHDHQPYVREIICMLTKRYALSRRALGILATSTLAIAVTPLCRAYPVNAQQDASAPPGTVSAYQSHSSEEDHAHSYATHRYSSEADRAKDALLITEVKTALADLHVADGHAVVVDCDHGTVMLTGAVGSAADARRAVAAASRIDGVVAVKSHLKW